MGCREADARPHVRRTLRARKPAAAIDQTGRLSPGHAEAFQRTGRWHSAESGPGQVAFGKTWLGVNLAARSSRKRAAEKRLSKAAG